VGVCDEGAEREPGPLVTVTPFPRLRFVNSPLLPPVSRSFPPAVANVYIVSFRSHDDDRPSKFIVLAENMRGRAPHLGKPKISPNGGLTSLKTVATITGEVQKSSN
jgi:hypothetical protein